VSLTEEKQYAPEKEMQCRTISFCEFFGFWICISIIVLLCSRRVYPDQFRMVSREECFALLILDMNICMGPERENLECSVLDWFWMWKFISQFMCVFFFCPLPSKIFSLPLSSKLTLFYVKTFFFCFSMSFFSSFLLG